MPKFYQIYFYNQKYFFEIKQIIRQIDPGNIKLIYATYHVDVGETPFLIVVDYSMRAVVVSIRGTLSLKVIFI